MSERALLLPVLFPALAALLLARAKRPVYPLRNPAVMGAALLNSAFLILLACSPPEGTLTLFRLSERAAFALHLDGLGRAFALMIAALWPPTTLYAFEYMRHEGRENTFYAWFTLTYGVVSGVALAANLLTLYLFYEVMTLATLPLVMHAMDGRARYAGRKYLIYSVGGASCAFITLAYSVVRGGGGTFALGGILDPHLSGSDRALAVYLLGFMGFGVKAAVFPFHGWLPSAAVAPTPVSALLHAVAVVKAGVFSITRLTWYVFGPGLLQGAWVQTAAFALACASILYGSSMGLVSQHLKQRLAWSTIGQLSYMLMGVLLLTPEGLAAALVHMGAHAVIKINLFFCAGAILCRTRREYVFDMRGIGFGMPRTFLALLVSGLALCGLPPMAGFVGKWQLGVAAAAAGPLGYFGVGALGISAVLTVLYIFSVFSIAVMPGKNFDFKTANAGVSDPGPLMLIPMGLLALGALLYGLYGGPVIELCSRIASGEL